MGKNKVPAQFLKKDGGADKMPMKEMPKGMPPKGMSNNMKGMKKTK